MAHKHSVYDTDPHFSINPITRAIKNESSGKVTLIQGDHNSERFSFDMPRMIEEHDMLQCDKVKVHFINTGKDGTTADAHDVEDFQVSPDGDDTVVFSWLISGNATKHVGPLQFAVEFLCTTDGVIDYAWHTAVFAGISVSTGMNNGEAIVEQYSDILEQWREQLFSGASNEISPEDIQEAVNNYLTDNPVQTTEIDETLKKSGAAADAAVTGQKISELENNKLDASKLSEAVNTALTQAKESGQFDGDPGDPGEPGQAATLEIVGADSLAYGSTPTVTEEEGSTAQARKYRLGIPEGKPSSSSDPASGGAGIDDENVSGETTYSSQKIKELLDPLNTGITRVESLDTTTPGGLVNLRDLETGLYVLYGYFSPYANSDMSMIFDNTMVVVSRKTAGSHLLVFTGLNSKVNFLEILVDESQPGGHTYTRTDFVMLDMHNLIAQVGSLESLSTEDKSSIVAAINELAQKNAGGSSVELDTTLAVSGQAADAKATGDAIAAEKTAREQALNELKEAIDNVDGGVYYNATAYGISTDAEDNTPALQALMDEVHAAGGGVIWFPVGVYKFKKANTKYAVLAKSNVSIIGENIEKTVLKQVEAAPYSLFYCFATATEPITGCVYQNFTVDAYETGNTNQVYGKAFFYQYVKNCVFRDLILQGTIATAMGIDYLDHVVIDNVTCIDCGRTYTGTQEGTSGIGIGTGGWADENVLITNCVCVGCGQYGIFLENQYNQGWGGNVAYSAGAIVSNCIVRNGLNKGIGVRGGENVTIIGCESYENASHGVYIDSKCKNVKIVSCSVTANRADGIRIEPDAESSRVHVRDCTVCDNTGSAIRVNSAFDNLCIANSYTDGNDVGLSIGSYYLSDAVIHGNTVLDSADVAAFFGGNTEYNDYVNGTTVVMPESITANDVVVTEGKTVALAYSVSPTGASNAVTFSSTNQSIATVSVSGVVTGVSEGSCQIIITSQVDSGVSKTINCTVSASQSGDVTPADEIVIPTADFTSGMSISSTGEEGVKSGAGVSTYHAITAGFHTISIDGFDLSDGGRVALYDANKTFVRGVTIHTSEAVAMPAVFEVGDDEVYMRLSVNVLNATTATITKVHAQRVSEFTNGYKLTPNGNVEEQTNAAITDYIPCDAATMGDTITVWCPKTSSTNAPFRVAQYDSNKTSLSDSFPLDLTAFDGIDALDGCAYVRVMISNLNPPYIIVY